MDLLLSTSFFLDAKDKNRAPTSSYPARAPQRLDICKKNRLNVSKISLKGKMLKISAILLGAGQSTRMGDNKLLLPWRKKTVLERCLDTLLRSQVREVIVVLGERTQDLRSRLQGPRVKVVINLQAREGMSTSIRKGLHHVAPDSRGILIALGDQPLIQTRTVDALIRAFTRKKGRMIVPSYRGRQGNPVLFDRQYEKELLRLRRDVGGRSILQKYPRDVFKVRIRSDSVIKDMDTWEQYGALKLRHSAR